MTRIYVFHLQLLSSQLHTAYGYANVLMSFRRHLYKNSARILGQIDLNTFTQTIKKLPHFYWKKCMLAVYIIVLHESK